MSSAAIDNSPLPIPATHPAVTPAPATQQVAAAPAKAVWQNETVLLEFPVTLADNKVIGAITLREPDLEGLERLDEIGLKDGEKPTLKQSRQMVEILSGQPVAVLHRLHPNDFAKLVEKMAPLLGGEVTA